jgi:hypothetical protein
LIVSSLEILASIASEYADWIHGIKDEFVTSKDNLEGFGTVRSSAPSPLRSLY